MFDFLFGDPRTDGCPIRPGELIEWNEKRYSGVLRVPHFLGGWLAVERRATDDAAPLGAPIVIVTCARTAAWQRTQLEAQAQHSAMILTQTHHRGAWYATRVASDHPKDCRADAGWIPPEDDPRPFLDKFCPAHREMIASHYTPYTPPGEARAAGDDTP